jgi:hypothetical protein
MLERDDLACGTLPHPHLRDCSVGHSLCPCLVLHGAEPTWSRQCEAELPDAARHSKRPFSSGLCMVGMWVLQRRKGGRFGRGLWATRGIAAEEGLYCVRMVWRVSSLLLKAGFERLFAVELVVATRPVPHESSHNNAALRPYSLVGDPVGPFPAGSSLLVASEVEPEDTGHID